MEYDIALSFAGEDRDYVQQVAAHLVELEVRVFYDEYEKVTPWGRALYTHLRDVYQNKAQFTVMFISKEYADNLWTSHEREGDQARAFSERREYILSARFDDTGMPGLLPTVYYIDLRETTPEELARLIKQKLDLFEIEPASTALSGLNNPELAVKALTFIGRLREELYQQEITDLEFNLRVSLELSTSKDDQSKNQKFQAYKSMSERLRAQFVHRYNSGYRIEAILLRNEMLSRVPEDFKVSSPKFIEHSDEYAASSYDLRHIVDDLEKLARSLPH